MNHLPLLLLGQPSQLQVPVACRHPEKHPKNSARQIIGCWMFDVGCWMFPNFWHCACILLLCLLSLTAHAHIGSPDIFFDGTAGPYPVRVTVRMPGVVPGRAEISSRGQTPDPVEVSFL